MDLATARKLKAIKSSKIKRLRNFQQFLYNLILQLLIAAACTVLLSYSFWFALLKQCILVTLPNASSYFLSQSCSFLAVNVIIIALVWDSRVRCWREPSPGREIYDEYVRRSNVRRKQQPVMSLTRDKFPKEEEKLMYVKRVEEEQIVAETMLPDEDVERNRQLVTSEIQSVADANKDLDEADTVIAPSRPSREDNEDDELPDDEFHKRVESFIARVNRQWCLEAR